MAAVFDLIPVLIIIKLLPMYQNAPLNLINPILPITQLFYIFLCPITVIIFFVSNINLDNNYFTIIIIKKTLNYYYYYY